MNHNSYINALEKINETLIAAGDEENCIKIWNWRTGSCINSAKSDYKIY